MKILHIGKFYSPIEGGIESINRFIVETLKGNSQRVLSFNNRRFSIEEDIDGISIVRASSPGVVASQPLSFKYFGELKRFIRQFQPEIIHFHYPNPLGALYLLMAIDNQSKLIVHWHSDVVAQHRLHWFIRPIENRLLCRADVVIATSPEYAKASSNLQHYSEKVRVIPCSIDENKFEMQNGDKEVIEAIRDRYCNRPIVFFVGRHVEYKGIRYLLEAERLVTSDCVFVIAGQGPLTAQLKEKYTSSRIYWIGRISNDEMRQYYYASTALAFPSITRNEAFGVVLAESMFCGCPAITFNIKGSGVNWVSVNGETCIEVQNRDVAAYAKAIDRMIANNILRSKLAENSHIRAVANFTRQEVARQYISLYNSLMTAVSTPPI